MADDPKPMTAIQIIGEHVARIEADIEWELGNITTLEKALADARSGIERKRALIAEFDAIVSTVLSPSSPA